MAQEVSSKVNSNVNNFIGSPKRQRASITGDGSCSQLCLLRRGGGEWF